MREGKAKRADSILGRAISTVALAVALTECRCNFDHGSGSSAGAGPWLPIAKTGAEVWTIAGVNYNVDATYYLPLPGGLQFTVDYQVPSNFTFAGITDEAAFRVAMPLMKHILFSKTYERTAVRDGTGKMLRVEKIGVALFERAGLSTRGYRVARSLSEVQNAVNPEAPR